MATLNWANIHDPDMPTPVKDCLARTDWKAICDYASRAFAGQDCEVLPDYAMGGSRLARLVRFQDGTTWLARVPLLTAKLPTALDTSLKLQAEVDTMVMLRARTQIPLVPHVFACETGHDNPAGAPFVLFEWLPGHTASEEAQRYERTDWGLIPLPFRKDFYVALAKAHVQIASARLPQIGTVKRAADGTFTVRPIPGIGGPFDTASSFIQAWTSIVKHPFTERYLRECVPTPPEWIDDILQGADSLPRRLANLASSGKSFTAEGPFPIRHADFWHSNVVVDKEFHVLGIIDWEDACTVPWELVDAPCFLNTVPRLLDPPEGYYNKETGEPLGEDVKESWAEKREYAEMVRQAEQEAGADHRLSRMLTDWDAQDLAATFHLFLHGKVGLYGQVLDYFENQ